METVKIPSTCLYLKGKQKRLLKHFWKLSDQITKRHKLVKDSIRYLPTILAANILHLKRGELARKKNNKKLFFVFLCTWHFNLFFVQKQKPRFFRGNYFAKMYYFHVKSACGVVLPQRKILYVVSEGLASNRPTSNCWYLWLWSKVSKKNSMPFSNWNLWCCSRHHP